MNAVVVKAGSARVDTAAAETVIAVHGSKAARADLAAARALVKVISDSQVSIDSGPPIAAPPAIIQLIGRSDRVQSADADHREARAGEQSVTGRARRAAGSRAATRGTRRAH